MSSALKYLIGLLASAFLITLSIFEESLSSFIIAFSLTLTGTFIAFYLKEKYLAWGILTSLLTLYGLLVCTFVMVSQLH